MHEIHSTRIKFVSTSRVPHVAYLGTTVLYFALLSNFYLISRDIEQGVIE